jgi:tRNA (guanine26-N2/guanine27-N2)-dimethyltransferase
MTRLRGNVRCSYQERGMDFHLPPHSFFRSESAIGRDLSVLAASVYRKRALEEAGISSYRCLDAFAGSGMRGARYLVHAGASAVHSNDFDPRNLVSLKENLLLAGGLAMDTEIESYMLPGLKRPSFHIKTTDPGGPNLSYSCIDASRLLQALALNEDYYDLVDLDSFGTGGMDLLSTAIQCVKWKGTMGGLIYLTSTDGFCSAGHRNERSLSAFGAFVKSTPFPNELGLRILIGAAVQAGARLGLKLVPVFSLYSYHGPVFRVMLKVTKSAEWAVERYSFLGYCWSCGQMEVVPWGDLGGTHCKSCGKKEVSISGPMWTGQLHNLTDLMAMQAEANAKGWTEDNLLSPGSTKKTKKSNAIASLGPLLEMMLHEADERLHPAYYTLAQLSLLLTSTPPRDKLIAALRLRGHSACLSHLEPRAIRTSARIPALLQCCTEDLGLGMRPGAPRVGDPAADPRPEPCPLRL